MLLPWIPRCHQLASVTFCTSCSAFWRHKWISFILTLSKESKATSFPAHHSGWCALRCDVNAFQRNQHPGMFCLVLKQTTSVHFISGLTPHAVSRSHESRLSFLGASLSAESTTFLAVPTLGTEGRLNCQSFVTLTRTLRLQGCECHQRRCWHGWGEVTSLEHMKDLRNRVK